MAAFDHESRVLVLYTGGTIGMLHHPEKGYVPETGFLEATLRAQARFHDPLGDSIWSHSGDINRFRTWHASSSASGSTSPAVNIGPPPHTLSEVITSNPDGTSKREMLPTLITPPTKSGRRIRYAISEYKPLIDSSHISFSNWIRLARDVELNYANWDGFLILHGTDTMAYTASALSFLLQDLGKSVIVTGSQIPLSSLRTDAVENLLVALILAGSYVIPEVTLYFNFQLFRGNRTTKSSSDSFDAFSSPNFPPLVKVGINPEISWSEILHPSAVLRSFSAHSKLCENIAILKVFPGMSTEFFRQFFQWEGLRGVVIETFGAGNMREDANVLGVLKEAYEKGIVVVNITQSATGSVSAVYAGGYALLQVGVVPGGDLTTECALAKLSYLCSKELSPTEIRSLISKPLRGEISEPKVKSESSASLTNGLTRIHQLISHISKDTSEQIPVSAKGKEVASWSTLDKDVRLLEVTIIPQLIRAACQIDDVNSLSNLIEKLDGDLSCLNNAEDSSHIPLHICALYGSVDCCEYLLAHGALVHQRDTLSHTALYYAARQNHLSTVQVLRKTGAILAGQDIDGGFATLAVSNLIKRGGDLSIWAEAGYDVESHQP